MAEEDELEQSDNTDNEQETEVDNHLPSDETEKKTTTDEPEEKTTTDEIEKKTTTSSNASFAKSTEATKSITNVCADLFMSIFRSRYYRQIVKSVVVFLLALKMARESKTMLIPIKEYEPFRRRP